MDRSSPVHPRAISAREQARLQFLRRWSDLLDNAFQIPGTTMRWGWDPIVGLIPGFGDALTAAFSALVLLQAYRMRIPRVVQARMVINVLIDACLGIVPVVGDLFDVAWKSNVMNFRLLELHAFEHRRPGRGDWVFVAAMLGLLVLSILVPIVAAAWLVVAIGRPLV